jgi:hypothetical protein
MPGFHPVHSVGRELRKRLKALFPQAEIYVGTHGTSRWSGYHRPFIDVLWHGDPSQKSVETLLRGYASDDYKLTIRQGLTAEDLRQPNGEQRRNDWRW